MDLSIGYGYGVVPAFIIEIRCCGTWKAKMEMVCRNYFQEIGSEDEEDGN